MKISILSFNIEGISLKKNYLEDKSLRQYILNKGEYLNKFFLEINADIICLQEYMSFFLIKLENYNSIKIDQYAIFFKKNKFNYVNHHHSIECGLVLELDMNGLIFNIGSMHLAAGYENVEIREEQIEYLDQSIKGNFIYAIDTNMKKQEEKKLNKLIDCFNIAESIKGEYTYDCKINPHFSQNEGNNMMRYDKIFASNKLKCKALSVIKPKKCNKLIHKKYPFGSISDHYPLLAIINISSIESHKINKIENINNILKLIYINSMRQCDEFNFINDFFGLSNEPKKGKCSVCKTDCDDLVSLHEKTNKYICKNCKRKIFHEMCVQMDLAQGRKLICKCHRHLNENK